MIDQRHPCDFTCVSQVTNGPTATTVTALMCSYLTCLVACTSMNNPTMSGLNLSLALQKPRLE